jgi:asparagine synthase (glutamine-hydrolysing)
MTVALSGDGGDELFFGYERPVSLLGAGSLWRWPWSVRAGLYGLGKLGLGRRRSDVLLHDSPGAYYLAVNSRLSAELLARLAPDLPGLPADFTLYDQGPGDAATLADFSRHAEFYGQLQRGLKKVDMASMSQSLEVRVPLLDREILEVALRVDPREHLAAGRKTLLRALLATHVPAALISPAKRGFAIPLAEWLRGSWRARVEETLLDGALWPSGLFRRPAVERLWQEHLAGQDHKWALWTLLTLQFWAQSRLRDHG